MLQEEDAADGEDGEVKRSMRPTTARRRPPKIKEEVKVTVPLWGWL